VRAACLKANKHVNTLFQGGKDPFLIIQLLTQFGFSHRTSKPDIFYHPTLKTVHNWPLVALIGGFNFFLSTI
jgi:hypothetical protein